MAIYQVSDDYIFPPVEMANRNGILAVGGDLSPKRLLHAYLQGIFPWYSEGEPIIWWSPDPRFVLFPPEIRISRSMRQVIKKNIYTITYDTAFARVIRECGRARKGQDGTWITREMREAYTELHELGIAHSVEAWQDGKLAGGLYGVSLGRCFFGESMFTNSPNASKAAFIHLATCLRKLDFILIDCQVYTNHLMSLGAKSIARAEFLNYLDESLNSETLLGKWNDLEPFRNPITLEELHGIKNLPENGTE